MNEIFKLFGTVAINGVDEAELEIKGLTDTAAKSENKLVSSFKKIGSAVAAAFAVDKIISFGQAIAETAATVAAEESAFAQIMGDYADVAAEKMGKVADAVGMVDTRLTPYMTSLTAKFKGLGHDIDKATDFAARGLTLAADAAAFWDKSLDESMSHLNSFINGSYEGGEAIGLFANDTQMALYAVEQGIISSKNEWASLDEATKQATRLQYAENMLTLAGATGQASKESSQYANVQGNLAEKWRQFKAQIGEPILQNIVIPAMIKLCDVVDALSSGYEKASTWVSENGDKIQKWAGYIVAAGTGVGTFLLYLNWGQIMSAASAALNLVTSSVQKLNATIAANPIGFIISLITSLITYLVYLYNTNEDFRVAVDAMLSMALEKLQEVIAWIQANVIPVVQEVIAWIQANVLPVIQSVLDWIQANVIPVVQTVVDWLQESIGAFWSWLTGVFSGGSGTIGTIWETIKGYFVTAWEFIQSVWAACQPFFDGIWNGIILPVWGLIQEMIGAFQMAWDVIKLAWGYVEPFFAGLWEAIKAGASTAWTYISLVFQNAWEVIKLIWGVAVEFFQLVWVGIEAAFSVVSAVLGGFFRTAWETIKSIWSVAISYFTLVWAGIKAVFSVVKGVLSGDFSDAWAAIKNVWDKAKSFFSTVWSGIKDVFSAVTSWFGNTFSAAWTAVKNVFSGWGAFFSGLWDKIKNTFSNLGTNIADAIGSAVTSGINGVISYIEGVINTAIELINGAINLINLIPGVDVGHVGDVALPRMAQGGIVRKRTVAEIGEDGAEAIVPLEHNTGWIDKVAAKFMEQQKPTYSDALLELLEDFFPQLLVAMERDVVLDTGATVGALAAPMNAALGKISSRKGRGR